MDFLSKEEIRKFISNTRDAIHAEQKEEWDNMIFRAMVNSEFYRKAAVIFTFVSFRSEVDTHRLINHAIEDKKVVCVPKIISKKKGIEVFKIDSLSDLDAGYFGVQEPTDKCARVNIEDIDLILMPGMAFDREGGRVGYGGGFYDKFITKMGRKVDKIALAYHFQILDKVPMDDNDVRIDGVITNEEMILINKDCGFK